MTRVDQRQVLEAFSRDYTREVHDLSATDLGRFPHVVFQQLYNRLQWEVVVAPADDEQAGAGAGRAGRLLATRRERALARRSAATVPLWLHAVTSLRESAGS